MSKDSQSDRSDDLELPFESKDEAATGSDDRNEPFRWIRGRRPPALFEFDDAPEGDEADESTAAAHESGDRGSERAATGETGPATVPARRSRGKPELEPMFEEAKAAAASGRVHEATETYRKIVSADPAHVRARNNLGVLLDQGGGHKAALEHFQAAVDLEPDNTELLTNFGAALAAEGRYDEAEAQLRKAARLDPGGVDVRANLGILYFRRGLYGQSEQELRWVCEQDAEHGLAHFYRGEALNRLGRVEEALETLERALHLQPGKARIYYLLGILYDKKNLPQEAAGMYRKARELSDP